MDDDTRHQNELFGVILQQGPQEDQPQAELQAAIDDEVLGLSGAGLQRQAHRVRRLARLQSTPSCQGQIRNSNNCQERAGHVRLDSTKREASGFNGWDATGF